jgi:NodT family efflux transporter outer membrane factor (OMF) lipoprotein
MRPKGLFAASVALALLSGCAVGPNYHPPTPPATPETGAFIDPGMSKVSTAPAQGAWWHLFNDPALDRLIADALAHNTDIRQASANLKRARAVLSEAKVAQFPITGVSGRYTRSRVGADQSPFPYPPGVDAVTSDFFSAGFDASYEVDLFGRVSRSIEAARGDAEAQQAALDGARVSVAAETARTYAQACNNAAQADVARETARLQDETLDLTRRLFSAGRGTQRDVDQAVVLAEDARAQVPLFEAERRASLYALAVLTGHPPSEIDADASRCMTPPGVTTLIPVGDGAALLARRPDVRQAERTLAAETARIGVATTELFPSVTLAGAVSVGSRNFDRLGKSSAFSYSFGPLISWTFPNIGAAQAHIRQARASTQAALAAFDGTMLAALKEVEQALARYSGALESNVSAQRSEQAASDAANIAELRFKAGRDSFLQLLDADRDRASSRAALARSNAQLADAQVSLFKALGGGWEGAPEPQRAER